MESIKETELNLQREVVTTVPNTWLVEAVNPSTGEKKMIDIANYASVVAGTVEGKYESSGSLCKSGSNIADANTVHIDYSLKAGSYCFKVAYNTTANIPINTNGMLVHTQRADYNNVSTTNIVKQVYNSHSSTFIRHGRGDGENIVFSDWQRIDNFGYNTLAELASGMGIGTKKGYSIESGDEVDLGVSNAGLYVLTNSESGNAAMCLVSSYTEGALTEIGSSGSGTRFSTSLTAEGFIGFGRKTTNGNLFLVNNRTSLVTVVVRYYT